MDFNSRVCDVFKAKPEDLNEVFYMAGWLYPFKEEYKHLFTVRSHVKNIDIVNHMRLKISKKLSLIVKNKEAGFTFKCKKIAKDVVFCEEYALSLKNNKDEHFINFAKGVLESKAMPLPNGKLIFDSKIDLVRSVLDNMGCMYEICDSYISVINVIDCLWSIYPSPNNSRLCKWFEFLKNKVYNCIDVPVTDIHEKKYMTDAGADISAVGISTQYGDNVFILETNTAISIPDGYWGLLAPRSSMARSGFMMTNSIGVIDSSYRGKIKIAVTKIDKAAELVFPFKCAQLIIIPQVMPRYISSKICIDTMRGDGGYGSTGL